MILRSRQPEPLADFRHGTQAGVRSLHDDIEQHQLSRYWIACREKFNRFSGGVGVQEAERTAMDLLVGSAATVASGTLWPSSAIRICQAAWACFDAIRLCRVVLDHDNDVLVSFRQATIRGLLSGAASSDGSSQPSSSFPPRSFSAGLRMIRAVNCRSSFVAVHPARR